uniref:Uncharacterized protein n=1 Tax=Lygus hesperus TaxID=30085 RepID=A0A0K8SN00_LYGHE
MKTIGIVVITAAVLGVSPAASYEDYEYLHSYQQSARGYQPPFVPQPAFGQTQQPNYRGYQPPYGQAQQPNHQGFQPSFDQPQPLQNAPRKFKSIEITPQLEKMVHQGLRMVNYDPNNVQVQKASVGRNLFRISYMNPMFDNQRC